MPTGLGLRPGAKAPDEPPNPTGYAPPLDSTCPNGPVPLTGDIADVGLRQAEGLCDGHLRDSSQRDRLRHTVDAWLHAKNRELLLDEHPE